MCSYILFDKLEDSPNIGGIWSITSAPTFPVSISVNGVSSNYNSAATISINHDVEVNLEASPVGTYVFTYLVGAGGCTDTSTVTITLVAGIDTGSSSTRSLCSNSNVALNIMDILAGETGLTTQIVSLSGTWSGSMASPGFAYPDLGDSSSPTFNPSLSGNGTFVYNYSGSTEGGDVECSNCSPTSTVTFIVSNAISAGSPIGIVLCKPA